MNYQTNPSGGASSQKSFKWYNVAEGILFLLPIATIVNIVLSYTESQKYFICSLRFSYTYFGENLLMTILSVIPIALFIVAGFLMKKHRVWLIICLVLTALDTFYTGILLYVCINVYDISYAYNFILDLFAHVVCLAFLVIGLIKSKAYFTAQKEASLSAASSANDVGTAANVAASDPQAPVSVACVFMLIDSQMNAGNSFKERAAKFNSILQNQSRGFVEFRGEQITLSGSNTVSTALAGSFSSPSQKACFSRSDIVSVVVPGKTEGVFGGKNEIQITLNDGQKIAFSFGKKQRESFLYQLHLRGVSIAGTAQ